MCVRLCAVADPGFANLKGEGDANILFGQHFPENCTKMKEIGLGGVMHPQLDPPMLWCKAGPRVTKIINVVKILRLGLPPPHPKLKILM